MNKKLTPAERAKIIRRPWGITDVLKEKRIREKLADKQAAIEAYKAKLKHEYLNGPYKVATLTPAMKAEAKQISDRAIEATPGASRNWSNGPKWESEADKAQAIHDECTSRVMGRPTTRHGIALAEYLNDQRNDYAGEVKMFRKYN